MDTRHRRHWCLIADQLGHEAWTNDQVATIVRLITHMHERWARDGLTPAQANTCTIGFGDLMRITDAEFLWEAVDRLLSVAQCVSVRIEINGVHIPIALRSGPQLGNESATSRQRVLNESITSRRRNWYKYATITWPKFAEFQRLTGPIQSHNGPKSEPPVPVPVPEPKKDTPPTPSERGPWPSIQALVELYNRIAPDECPAVETLSEGRRKKIRTYLRQFPDETFWRECFDEIRRSPFLRGLKNRNGHHNFVADLDWLLQKGLDGTENCVKTRDGKYREE